MKKYLSGELCPNCSKNLSEFVPPEVPKNPDIILVGEAPGKDERIVQKDGKKHPFVGKSGQILRGIISQLGIKPILINSQNYWTKDKPSTEVIKAEREQHLIPLIENYKIPIVALGRYAAQAILGGKQSERIAGESLWLFDRPVLFTYHPAYALRSGWNEEIIEHIKVHIETALMSIPKPKYHLNKLDIKYNCPIVIDIESNSVKYPWQDSRLVVIGVLPIDSDRPYLFTHDFLKKSKNSEKLKRYIRNAPLIIGHNLMFDLVHLSYHGYDFAGKYHDTLIYIKNEGKDYLSLGLKYLAKLCGYPAYEAKIHTAMREKPNMEDIDIDIVLDYNAYDLYATRTLYEHQQEDTGLFAMDMDYIEYIRQMIMNGLYFSKRKLSMIKAEAERSRKSIEDYIKKKYKLGEDFNIKSPSQLKSLLSKLGIKVENTNKQTLLQRRADHEIIGKLFEYRAENKKIEKVDEIMGVLAKDSCVHAAVSVHGTETGRLTASKPNIENIAPYLRQAIVSRYK